MLLLRRCNSKQLEIYFCTELMNDAICASGMLPCIITLNCRPCCRPAATLQSDSGVQTADAMPACRRKLARQRQAEHKAEQAAKQAEEVKRLKRLKRGELEEQCALLALRPASGRGRGLHEPSCTACSCGHPKAWLGRAAYRAACSLLCGATAGTTGTQQHGQLW